MRSRDKMALAAIALLVGLYAMTKTDAYQRRFNAEDYWQKQVEKHEVAIETLHKAVWDMGVEAMSIYSEASMRSMAARGIPPESIANAVSSIMTAMEAMNEKIGEHEEKLAHAEAELEKVRSAKQK